MIIWSASCYTAGSDR